ncbi:MFS general substrate transporter [Auricularia subglabra TFB-10046 SS5]|nr:MFS general substrate transporter [Auricularia subglabra TFB-10046 SS5]
MTIPRVDGAVSPSDHILVQSPTPKALESSVEVVLAPSLDIEHAPVLDDPRAWSAVRKSMTLILVSTATLVANMAVNIYTPALNNIKAALGATDVEMSLSVALFIVIQGTTPLLWSVIGELKGRKFAYVGSLLMFTVGCAGAAASRNVGVLIAMRLLQGLGSSVAAASGAATLADIYDKRERGTKLGIYYSIPVLGPTLGPLIGGIIVDISNWRATFWFLVIAGGVLLLSFLFLFRETFRPERSLAYQRALKHALKKAPTHINSDVKPHLADVKLLHPFLMIVRRINNLGVLLPSGNLLGSIAGGYYSDRVSMKCAADPARQAPAETRLNSAIIVMWILPPSIVCYAWFAQEHIHVAGVCVALFLAGLLSIWTYATLLAYLVDANVGRVSAASAANSCFRGVAGFISAEVALSLQAAIGDAPLYMIWAGVMVAMGAMILLAAKRGTLWRENMDAKERETASS